MSYIFSVTIAVRQSNSPFPSLQEKEPDVLPFLNQLDQFTTSRPSMVHIYTRFPVLVASRRGPCTECQRLFTLRGAGATAAGDGGAPGALLCSI